MGRQAPAVFSYWYNLIILNRQGFGWGYHGNQSWRALIHRMFTDENTGSPHLEHINFTVNQTAANIAYYAGVIVIIALIVWAAHHKSISSPIHRFAESPAQFDFIAPVSSNAVEYGLVFCGMLMISSLSWKDHYVALILPYTVLMEFVLRTRSEASKHIVAALLSVSFLLCTMTNMSIIGGYWSETLETFSAEFFGVCGVVCGIIVCSNQRYEWLRQRRNFKRAQA